MSKDTLGDRMKRHENAFRHTSPDKLPLIIRVDGKAFHSYTKGCERPLDANLANVMNETAQYLCKNIMNAKIAYVQSDEISILCTNYTENNTQAWFDGTIQKMASVSAGMASAFFTSQSGKIFNGTPKLAIFDSRVFVLPKEDVNNYFLWRQQDATRNSVQMLARSLYSHKECNNKNNAELQEMCFKKGVNWNDMPVSFKRGRCIVKKTSLTIRDPMMIQRKDGTFGPPPNFNYETIRRSCEPDLNIPVFSQDLNYINQFVFPPVPHSEKE